MIDDYLDGALTPSLHQQMEEALASDRSLGQEVAAQRELRARLEAMRLRKTIQKHLKARYSGWNLFIASGMAASILLVAGLFWWNSTEKGSPDKGGLPLAPLERTDEPANGNDRSLPTDSPTTSPQATLELERISPSIPAAASPAAASITNRKKLLAETIADLEIADFTIMGQGDMPRGSMATALLQGAQSLQRGELEMASNRLLEIPEDAPQLFRDEADWLLALAWMSQGQTKGDTLLASIASKADHAHRFNALRLKIQLEGDQ